MIDYLNLQKEVQYSNASTNTEVFTAAQMPNLFKKYGIDSADQAACSQFMNDPTKVSPTSKSQYVKLNSTRLGIVKSCHPTQSGNFQVILDDGSSCASSTEAKRGQIALGCQLKKDFIYKNYDNSRNHNGYRVVTKPYMVVGSFVDPSEVEIRVDVEKSFGRTKVVAKKKGS